MDKNFVKIMKETESKVKTYEAKGMVELTLHLISGLDSVPDLTVTFEGGKMTCFGVTPATYTTSDPFIQHLIENCSYAKRGIIKEKGAKEEQKKK